MKIATVFMSFILALVLILGIKCIVEKSEKKNSIKEMMVDYKDSINAEQQNMLQLITAINATTDNPSQRMKAFAEAIDERTAINKRIYKYQWKVDSLQMVLNK